MDIPSTTISLPSSLAHFPHGTPATAAPIEDGARRAGDQAREEVERRGRRLRHELVVRLMVALVLVLFNELFELRTGSQPMIRTLALTAILLTPLYWLGVQAGQRLREQAYARTGVDVLLITAGLYAAGGLEAGRYVSLYAVVPIYAALVFSSHACLLATAFSSLSFLALAALHQAGLLPLLAPVPAQAWVVAGFNLLVLNVVGALAAVVAEAYRTSRRRLRTACADLERAHDELQRLNTYIQRASRVYVLGEVVAGVTHEMRNVLQGAFGHLDLARQKLVPLPADVAAHLDQVSYSCESAMRIIRSTLDAARQPDHEREPVALGEVAQRVADLKGFDLGRDGITLALDVPDTLPPVLGAPFQLQQVLLNLVANAQDALREESGPRDIEVRARAAAGEVTLEVRDSGPGIPLDVLPHVFEPFYTTKSSGTGLGLAISAGIVERLGGRLSAASDPTGAVFRLTLPAAA